MFRKVMVANRGEIACRVIKACQEMGIETVAIYSDVDKGAPHTKIADEIYPLGEPEATKSYLNMDKILEIAKKSGAEAIHPGYGFLAENCQFAKRCEEEGIKFIGPRWEVIKLMGDKVRAKDAMSRSGLPVIPGYVGDDQSTEALLDAAEKISYPVIIKASAGGGGKGMRIVYSPSMLRECIALAKNEARNAFGDDTLFIEKYIEKPRHIEFQILADEHGNVIHLFERECSIQRRYQKIIEETPSPFLTEDLRKKMGDLAVKGAKEIGYTNAGTMEFIMDKDRNFYFLEMNTRLQVEHTITEAVTGIDIVKWQLRIAAGEKLSIKQEDISLRGHAMECRIYAEDAERNFAPSTGKIEKFELPLGPNVRHEVGVEEGNIVSPHYDPMLAKLIVYAENRDECIDKMLWALHNYVALGVTTNIDFLQDVINHEDFRKGNIDTHFIDSYFRRWHAGNGELPEEVLVAAAIADYFENKISEVNSPANGGSPVEPDPHSPWRILGKWRIMD